MKKFQPYTRVLPWFMALLLSTLVAACGGGGGGKDPILGADVAAIAPRVIATTPLTRTPNVTGVSINAKVTATFSRDMTASTITTSTFKVACPAGTPVAGTVSVAYVASSRIATFSHTTNFPINTVCTATITTGVQSSKGVNMAQDYVWKFQTGATVDNIAPTITTTGAADGDTGLPINRNATVTFSEPMDPDSLTNSFTVKEFVSGAAVAGVVTYSGNTATFNPNSNLLPNTKYTSAVSTAATDLAGNALVSGARANPWSWTTGGSGDTTAPTVTLVNPLDLATGVCINKTINATFSEAMNQTTINDTTFTLQVSGPPLGPLLAGVYTYDVASNVSTFNPTSDLSPNTQYTATITTGVKDLAGNGLASDKVWTFTTGTTTCLPPVNLGTASAFGIAAHAGLTNTTTVPLTHIEGNVILDPLAQCNAVDVDAAGGFGLCGSNGSTPTITGTVFSHFYDPANIRGTVIADLNAAFLSITPPAGPPAAGSLGSPTSLSAGTTLGAPTGSAMVQGDNYFVPGLYQSITSIMVTGDLTLDAQGDANAVFVFQSSSTVGTAAGAAPPGVRSRILLINGAKASNVWWQAGTDATLGLYSEFQGNILAARDITMLTGATSCGRLMAGAWAGVGAGTGAFVFSSNVISVPGHPFAPPATYSTTCQ